MERPGKKTAAAVHEEIQREIKAWLSRIFSERRKSGRTDLEAVEMGLRKTVLHVGAAAIEELLQYEEPASDERQRSCRCGDTARYVDLRSKTILTVLGKAELRRPYYLCGHCGEGQFPADAELDVEHTLKSPGVRRMLAVVGQDAPFDHGRQQMDLLAGLQITAKEVERTAEAVGEDIAAREQEQIQRTMQLNLPIVVGKPVPIMYAQMDGTGVPVVKTETSGREGKTEGQPAHYVAVEKEKLRNHR